MTGGTTTPPRHTHVDRLLGTRFHGTGKFGPRKLTVTVRLTKGTCTKNGVIKGFLPFLEPTLSNQTGSR